LRRQTELHSPAVAKRSTIAANEKPEAGFILSTFIIFGASGAAGRFLLPQLTGRGDRVFAVSRRPRPSAARIAWLVGDLLGETPLPAQDVDVILSLGPLDAFSTWFERTPPGGVRRLIALSSMSADSKRDSPDPRERALAARLVAAEQRVAAAAAARGIAWTLFRPTLIYGGGRDSSLAPIARFARRTRLLPVPLGASGLRQPIHAGDIAAAIIAALDRPATFGRMYPLGGGERLRFDHMLLRLRRAVPGFVMPVPVPQLLVRMLRRLGIGGGIAAGGDAALRRLREPLIADNADAEQDFGYAPRAFDARAVCDSSFHDL
jgi:nucleoside-diphosphate-sugar epimerase